MVKQEDDKKQHKYLIYIGAAVLFFAVGFVVYIFSSEGKSFGYSDIDKNIQDIEDELIIDAKEPEILMPRKVDGVLVESGKENNFPIGVMIENHVDVRPQSSLSKANIVYEAPVEGGITRFLAVYTNYDQITEIGPIRSARTYYLDWIKGLDGLYLHVGGSPDALSKLKPYRIKDLDQYYLYQYYWRNQGIAAPHNVFTSGELIARALRDKGYEGQSGSFDSWKFKVEDENLDLLDEVADLVVNFSTPTYQARWVYDHENNQYKRYQGKVAHRDADGSQVLAKNIVLIYTPILVIDEEGRRDIKTIGSGKAMLFRDGQSFEGEWRKNSRRERLKIFIEDQEAEFNPGTTWVEIVSKTFDISY